MIQKRLYALVLLSQLIALYGSDSFRTSIFTTCAQSVAKPLGWYTAASGLSHVLNPLDEEQHNGDNTETVYGHNASALSRNLVSGGLSLGIGYVLSGISKNKIYQGSLWTICGCLQYGINHIISQSTHKAIHIDITYHDGNPIVHIYGPDTHGRAWNVKKALDQAKLDFSPTTNMGNVNGIYGNHYDETHCYIVPAKDSTLLASHEAQIAIYRQLQKAVDNHQRGETFNTSIQLIEHAPLLPYHRRVFPASHTTAKQEGASAIAIQEPQYICERDPHDHAYIVYPPQYAGKNASTHLNLR